MNSEIEVRRSNGECGFGPWRSADALDIPKWVGNLAADEMIECGFDYGQVEQGGSVWLYRSAKEGAK